ncbi:long-chain fatty acid--CoA ligase [Methylophaga sp. 42_25_T18]|nr:long-chain fatty acid--CoA ligase [Methylophaga sp. 42_25_T18]
MSKNNLDVISTDEAQTLYGLFKERLKRSPEQVAYRSYDSDSQTWYDTTWQQVAEHITHWQTALLAEGLEPGDRVALNLRNCKEWVFFDQAAMGLGLVVVPLYPDDRPDNVAYILHDADVKLVLLQNSKQWKRLAPSITEDHHLKRVVINNKDDEQLDSLAIYADEWLPQNSSVLHNSKAQADQLASIIYTSGTTGRPKGVMLSHHNMLSVSSGALQYFDIFPNDVFLSFLPLSHTLERTAGYYLPIMAGATVAYSRGIPQLGEDMLQTKPSVIIAVPRVFERIYARLQNQLASKSIVAKFLFKATVTIGWTRFLHQQKRAWWHPGFMLWPLFNKLVADKVQQRLGGNMRLIVTGGAALPQQVAKLFLGLGQNLIQGYGLTETSPVISVNEPDNNYPASVGRPLPGITVKIGDNDELLVQGPGNMLGYWNNHKATAQTIDAQGWLHTGDQAKIGDSGHIYITGRLKDILVLSNGEKVPPSDVEAAILMDDIFEQALIVGEGESYLSALLVLNSEHWFTLAKQHQLDAFDSNSLTNKKLHSEMIQRLRKLLYSFPAYAKIRRVTLTLEPWTLDNDLLTATLKVKRNKVIEHHQTDIDKMYQ